MIYSQVDAGTPVRRAISCAAAAPVAPAVFPFANATVPPAVFTIWLAGRCFVPTTTTLAVAFVKTFSETTVLDTSLPFSLTTL